MSESAALSTPQARDLWETLAYCSVTKQNAASLLHPLITLLPRHDIDTQALVRTTILVLASQDKTRELFQPHAHLSLSRLRIWADPSDPAVRLFHLHLRCNLNTSLPLERTCKELLEFVLHQLGDPRWWSREGDALLPLLGSLLRQRCRNGGIWVLDRGGMQLLQNLVNQAVKPFSANVKPDTSLSAGIKSWCYGKPLHPESGNIARFYEQHPYPHWDALDRSPMPTGLRGHLSGVVGPLAAAAITAEPKRVLVLGCGTGREALAWAAALPQSQIDGVDLSAASLGYASLMAKRLKLNNVNWHQEDLLRLPFHFSDYDLVTACGVLHHLPDPAEALQAVLCLVRPGGLIKLALYSELARRPIARAREILKRAMTDAPSREQVAHARQELIGYLTGDPELASLPRVQEFFDLDGFWDLFLNPCEVTFTLPIVEELVSGLGLNFLGFEWDDRLALGQYRALFPSDRDAVNLRYWACFEARYPQTFLGMYRFWCQRGAEDLSPSIAES